MTRRLGFVSRRARLPRRVHTYLLSGVLLMSSLGAAGQATAAGAHSAAVHSAAVHSAAAARADDGAYITRVEPLGRRMLDLMVESPAMRGGMPVRVILPKHWGQTSQMTFPVLYLLQGAGDNYTSWTRETDVEELADPADVLVVMPEGGRAGFYTDWWDRGSRTAPRWETFHTVELRQLMERAFRASGRRALVGLSEGGLGALNYAARHPGSYRFAGSLSGIVDISDPGMQFAIGVTCLREGVDPVRLWGRPDAQKAIWNAHNPSRMVSRFGKTWVYLYAATGAPGGLEERFNPAASLLERPLGNPTYAFARELRRAEVKVTTDLFRPGTHSWPYWQRELHRMWPSVLSALGARTPTG
ncbi:alpha/beta hydrolase family protein [Streptomyces sp. NPDC046197]|uniref:alpha/beta hydrolase n=1 Tax=Streptomyces sp. NPDC046197 TaxID=3154337 RepID=UPI00340B6294